MKTLWIIMRHADDTGDRPDAGSILTAWVMMKAWWILYCLTFLCQPALAVAQEYPFPPEIICKSPADDAGHGDLGLGHYFLWPPAPDEADIRYAGVAR